MQENLTLKLLSSFEIQIFLAIFVTLIASFFSRKILARLEKKAEKTENRWDDCILFALRSPVRIVILVLGFTFAAEIASSHIEWKIFDVTEAIRNVATVFAISIFALRFIKKAEENYVHDKEVNHEAIDKNTLNAVIQLLRISVIITSVIILMQTLGINISGVLAFGGVSGMAVGFAAKDLLANFFGAIMIYMDKPFAVGDWIRSPDRQIEGTVELIGWRQTRIRTFDKRPLYVPNSIFSTIAVENPSRMLNRRINERFGVRYDDMNLVANIVSEVKKMLSTHPEIDANQTLIVNLDGFADSSVDFFIYCFTKTTDWVKFHEIKQDVLLKIGEIVESNNASMAFPTTTLDIPQEIQIAQSSN